jgi:putative transposase
MDVLSFCDGFNDHHIGTLRCRQEGASTPSTEPLAVKMYVRFPLSLRNVEDLLRERGIEISHETVRFWWNRFGPMFAAEIRRKRVERMRSLPHWRWHLDEVFV